MTTTETNALSQAQSLTELSIQRTKTVREAWSVYLADELQSMCDDSVTDSHLPEAEYWGSDDEGNEWRVHLVRA